MICIFVTRWNVFKNHRFGIRNTPATRTHLGRIATRLYVSLYVTGMMVLILYTSINPRIVIQTLDNPTIATTMELQQKYVGVVECSCIDNRILYGDMVTIDVQFHQVISYHLTEVKRMYEIFRFVQAPLSIRLGTLN